MVSLRQSEYNLCSIALSLWV